MVMDHLLAGFFDEMEKIGVSTRVSAFMQSRSGRRPIRAETLLKKQYAFRTPPDEKTPVTEGELENAKDYEQERGPGMIEDPEGERR